MNRWSIGWMSRRSIGGVLCWSESNRWWWFRYRTASGLTGRAPDWLSQVELLTGIDLGAKQRESWKRTQIDIGAVKENAEIIITRCAKALLSIHRGGTEVQSGRGEVGFDTDFIKSQSLWSIGTQARRDESAGRRFQTTTDTGIQKDSSANIIGRRCEASIFRERKAIEVGLHLVETIDQGGVTQAVHAVLNAESSSDSVAS